MLEGIEACRRIGYGPIKINAVAVKNLVEPDIVPLARFGRERGIEIRYIEFMPLDAQGLWLRDKVLSADEMMAMLEREIGPLEEIPDRDPRAPATEYRFADGVGPVGFIASVTRPFCLNCNRLRLTADGKVRYCLFAIEETDVRGLIRGGAPDEAIAAGDPRLREREVDRAPDQLATVRSAAPADVLDRGVSDDDPDHQTGNRRPPPAPAPKRRLPGRRGSHSSGSQSA